MYVPVFLAVDNSYPFNRDTMQNSIEVGIPSQYVQYLNQPEHGKELIHDIIESSH